MIWIIIIFFLSIFGAFGMLFFRVWEIKTSRINISPVEPPALKDLSFRHLEKNVLYLAKHIVQSIVFLVVKYWFIGITRLKKWVFSKWPKIKNRLIRKQDEASKPGRPSFFERAVMESRVKIRRIKEKVRRDHEEIVN